MLSILSKAVTFARAHWRAVAVVLALAASFVAGRASGKQSPERVDSQAKAREREHTEATAQTTAQTTKATKQDRHVVIVSDVDTKPDGTRHEHTVTARVSSTVAQEHDLFAAARTSTSDRTAERLKTTVTNNSGPRVQIDALLATRVLPWQFPPEPLIGVQVKGRVGEVPILRLPISVGVFGLTDLQFKSPIVGVSGGVAF
jgi:hypothetical protein